LLLKRCFLCQGAVLLLGAICFHNSICGLFLIPQQEIHVHPLNCCRSNQKRNTVEEVKDCSRTSMKTTFKQESFLKRSWRLWKCPVFLLILLVDFLAWIATFVPYVHLVERARYIATFLCMKNVFCANVNYLSQ